MLYARRGTILRGPPRRNRLVVCEVVGDCEPGLMIERIGNNIYVQAGDGFASGPAYSARVTARDSGTLRGRVLRREICRNYGRFNSLPVEGSRTTVRNRATRPCRLRSSPIAPVP